MSRRWRYSSALADEAIEDLDLPASFIPIALVLLYAVLALLTALGCLPLLVFRRTRPTGWRILAATACSVPGLACGAFVTTALATLLYWGTQFFGADALAATSRNTLVFFGGHAFCFLGVVFGARAGWRLASGQTLSDAIFTRPD